jgi:hypothetical protein
VATLVRYTAAASNGVWPSAPTVTFKEETETNVLDNGGRTNAQSKQSPLDLYPKISEFSR